MKIKNWLTTNQVPEREQNSYIMNNLNILYTHLLTKGLVPEDRNAEEAFCNAANEKYFLSQIGV